jgi:hypothetical protein
MSFTRVITARALRAKANGGGRGLAATVLAAAVATSLAGCSSPEPQTGGMAAGPLPTNAARPLSVGKARISLERTSGVMYAGVAATVKLNDEKVADVWAGGNEIVDFAPGKAVLGVEAWSYPGVYRLELDAKAGMIYRVAIAPRGESFGPSLILGPLGGTVDKDDKGNSGAFKMQLAGSERARETVDDTPKAQAKPSGGAKAKKG